MPFQELLALGKYYGEQRKEAEEQLLKHVQTYGEFSSPSLIDSANYKKEAIGKMQPFIDEAVSNPEIMKSGAWRSRMANQMNNIDYGLLKRFKTTADNAMTRAKMVAELKAKGLYEEWFDDPRYRDLSNWDTATMGVMTNISPDKYVSMDELGENYSKNLKPTFYKGVSPNTGQKLPFHNWLAISSADIRRQFEDHAQDLLSTDAGAKHYARFRGMAK